MARPLKTGLDYFPLDTDMDMDDKVQLIEGLYKTEGFATVMKLLMKIYSEGFYYSWGEKEQILMAKRVGIDVELIKRIVNDCVKYGLFSEKLYLIYEILTSVGVQKRYFTVAGKRKKGEVIRDYLLLREDEIINLCPEITFLGVNQEETPVIQGITPVIQESSTQRKLKETKVNKTKVNNIDKSMSVETDVVVSSLPKTPIEVDYFNVMNYWNQHSKLKEIEKVTDKRKASLNARIKEFGVMNLYKAIDNCSESSFMRGNNSHDWMATFDWVFKPNNFVKVLEGNYNDKTNQANDEIKRRLEKVGEAYGGMNG